MPLSLAIVGGAAVGALPSLLVGLPGRIRQVLKGGDLRRRNARQQSEIARLQATTHDKAT